jgi:hypothetical protein
MMKNLFKGCIVIALLSVAGPAAANTIHFVRTQVNPGPGINRGNYNFVVEIVGQNGTDSGQCTMTFAQDECTVSNFPSKTKALVTVWQRPGTTGSDPRVLFGRMSFWVKESTLSGAGDVYIYIPTGFANFAFDNTPAPGSQISLMPVQYMLNAGGYGTPPNGGPGYTGELVGQVGGTCAFTGCSVPLLAGCYSVVFRVGPAGAVLVNAATSGEPFADNVLCIADGSSVDYVIQVP